MVAFGLLIKEFDAAITALATIAIGAFTYTLKKSTDRLWIAAELQRTDALVTSKRELRAYVGVPYAEVQLQGTRLIVAVDHTNTGKTPAHDVELKMSAEVLDWSEEGPAWVIPGIPEDEGKGGVIFPTVMWRRHIPAKGECGSNREAIIRQLENKKKRVWVWGVISYVDAFNETSTVTFRFKSSAVRRIAGPTWIDYFALIPDIAYTKATFGNEAYKQ